MKKRLIILFLIGIFLFSFNFVNAATNVSECGILSEGDTTYVLNVSLNSGDSCLFVNTSDIILDCSGYNITYGNSTDPGFGILAINLTAGDLSGLNNVTIKNCNFVQNETATNTSSAISFGSGSQNGVIYNNTFNVVGNRTMGVYLTENASNMSIYGNTFTIESQDSWGIYFYEGSEDCSIFENTITFNSTAGSNALIIHIGDDSNGANITSNNITAFGGVLYGIDLTGENSTIENNDINISGDDSAGIFIWENSESMNVSRNRITVVGHLSLGISTQDNTTGMNISLNNVTLSGTVSGNSNPIPGIKIGPNGTEFSVNFNIIDVLGNESSGVLIMDDASSGTIYSNTINISGDMNSRQDHGRGGIMVDTGVFDINMSSNTITTSGVNSTGIFVWGNLSYVDLNNITTSGINSYGIFLSSAEEMDLTNNNITTTGNNSEGILVEMSSDDSKVYNNLINTSGNSSHGIWLDSCTDGNLSNNNLTGTGGYGIYLNDCNDSLAYSNTIVNAETYGIYDYVSTSSNISSNTVSGTVYPGSGSYVYGIRVQNGTSVNVELNTLYGNDEGPGTYCGGILIWIANVTASSNIIYEDTNDSCTYPIAISMYLNSGENEITLNNNEINSSLGNNSYGLGLGTNAEASNESFGDVIYGTGNVIRNADVCISAEAGDYTVYGFALTDCGTYDASVLNGGLISPIINTTMVLINSSLNESRLNVNEACNITLQEYVRSYVDDGTSALSGATVVLTNNNSAEQQWSKTTASNGYTSYGEATYYFYNSTGGYNYSSMTVSVSKTGYDANSGTSVISGQSTMSVSLAAEESSSSTGGSSSGGVSSTSFWTSTYVLNSQELKDFEESEFIKLLSVKNRVELKINGTNHHVGVVELTGTMATINVSSVSQQAVFNIGDEKMFDVDVDGYYDMLISLINISSEKVNVSLKAINEPVVDILGIDNTDNNSSENIEGVNDDTKVAENNKWIFVGVFIIIALGLSIFYCLKYFKKKERK